MLQPVSLMASPPLIITGSKGTYHSVWLMAYNLIGYAEQLESRYLRTAVISTYAKNNYTVGH